METKDIRRSSGSPFAFSLPSPFTIDQLMDILKMLKRCGFPQARWYYLGLTLGIHKNTLDALEVEYRGDVSRCLTESLSYWLRKVDNVDSKGGATFDSLSEAFRSMNENAAAEKLDQEKAVSIFNTHHPLLSQSLSDPVNVSIMLEREGVITEQILARVQSASPCVPMQCEILFTAIVQAIQSKYSYLQTFASVLCKFTANVKLGIVIQKDYDEHFSASNKFVQHVKVDEEEMSCSGTITPPSPHTPTVEVPVRKSKSREFTSIRLSLARMIFKVSKAITEKSPPLIDLKSLICLFNSDLKAKLDNCFDISGVVYVIEGECSLTDIELLETVVEEFEVTEAQRYIEQYKITLEEFCHSISIELCLKEKFDAVNASPPLKCETVTYVFDWRPDEKKLKDITDILSKTSGKFVKIRYIDTGYSIMISCSFPFYLTGALIMKLGENLTLLIKNHLIKLTVGYITIWMKQNIQKTQKLPKEEVQELKEGPSENKEEAVEEKGAPQTQDLLLLDTSVAIISTQLLKEIETNKHVRETLDVLKKRQKHANSAIIRGMKMEKEHLLTNKTGELDQNESLLTNKKKIAELQEQISLTSIQILQKKEKNEEYRDEIKEKKKKMTAATAKYLETSKGAKLTSKESGDIQWSSDKVYLTKLSADQCPEVISKLSNNHRHIYLYDLSTDIAYLMMSQLLDITTIEYIDVENTTITKDAILLLSQKLTNNTSLKTLEIIHDSINDDGVIALSQSLIGNKAIVSLYLHSNSDITSTSAQSLAQLLLYNHTLSVIYLHNTSINTEGVLVLVESLRTNTTLWTLWLDRKHEEICYSLPYYVDVKFKLAFL